MNRLPSYPKPPKIVGVGLRVYQLALFVFQVAQRDIETLKQKKARSDLINQLYRAAGSVPANIVEGYGRNSGKERRHFFEVALGSAREVDLWYQESEALLGAQVVEYGRKVRSRLRTFAVPHFSMLCSLKR